MQVENFDARFGASCTKIESFLTVNLRVALQDFKAEQKLLYIETFKPIFRPFSLPAFPIAKYARHTLFDRNPRDSV